MPDTYHDVEKHNSNAISAISDFEKSNIKEARREFSVPYNRRLREHYKGKKSRFTHKPAGRRLDEA